MADKDQKIQFLGAKREVTGGELTLTDAGGNPSHVIPLKLNSSTIGPSALVISDVLSQTGMTLFSPGGKSSSLYESKITCIGADEGKLFYRGYPIEQLIEHSNFLEVCYLLRKGDLPTEKEMRDFSTKIFDRMSLMVKHVGRIQGILSAFDRRDDPMDMVGTILPAIRTFFKKGENKNDAGADVFVGVDIHVDPEQRENAFLVATAVMPVIVSMVHKYRSTGYAFVNPPIPGKTFEENFLHMFFSKPGEPFNVNSQAAREMGRIMSALGDHEQNASTAGLRGTLTTGAELFPSMAAATFALAGPSHGGASEACLKVLDAIIDRAKVLGDGCVETGLEKAADEAIARAKNKDDPYRLMGFGHRVYKNMDPRAKLLLKDLKQKVGTENIYYRLITMLVNKTANDEYFNELGNKKIYANVDLVAGMLERQLGFETEMAVVIFLLSRGAAGWPAHAEELLNTKAPIVRPLQVYKGPGERDYVELELRSIEQNLGVAKKQKIENAILHS